MSEKSHQAQWLIDSGASEHMTCYKECFQDYQQFSDPQSVKLGDGRVDALGLGSIKLRMTFKVSDVNVTMYDVLYVPKLSSNLFSVGAAIGKGNTAVQEISLLHTWKKLSSPWNGNTKS